MTRSTSVDHAATQVFEDFSTHVSQTRPNTEQSVATSLRQNYPDYTLTMTPSSAGLINLANAGKAKATLDVESGFHLNLRSFQPPTGRLSKEPGTHNNTVYFGRYDYEWQGHQFIIYLTRYRELYQEPRTTYILHKASPSDITSEGHDRVSDDLIAAAVHQLLNCDGVVFVYDQENWQRSTELFASVQSANWDQVILNPTLKDNIIQDVEGFFDSQSQYADFAVPWKRGIILHGLPGNGKTISIKAISNALYARRPDPIPTLYVKSLAGCRGPHYSIREIFVKAREMSPCLLVFEDLDSLIDEKVKSFFLNEVDGLECNDGIMMIGSTNHLERLDAGITKRPSRFDRKYHFTLPGLEERVQYVEFWRRKLLAKGKKGSQGVEFPEELCTAIARITEGFSFAYLKELFVTSLLLVVASKRDAEKKNGNTISGSGNGAGVTNGADQSDHLSDETSSHRTTSDDYILTSNPTTSILNSSLLGRILQKQIETLRVELEEAMKSIEDANGSITSSAAVAAAVGAAVGVGVVEKGAAVEKDAEEKEKEKGMGGGQVRRVRRMMRRPAEDFY